MRPTLIICFCLVLIAVTACTGTEETHPKSQTSQIVFVTVTPTLVLRPQPTPTTGPQPNVTLRDVAPYVGLKFQHGAFQTAVSEDPIAMMGGGLCWLDVENDGWLDLYVVNSHALAEKPMLEQQEQLPHNALYRNQGNGTFVNISAGSGTDLIQRGNGCLVGDINGDGRTDIYVTADGPNALLLNQGDGTFVDAGVQAGVAAPEWSSAAALADVDGDGRLDLFVASYINLERKVPNPIGLFPQDYLGLPDHLFRNMGDGTFEDVAVPAGLTHEERGLGAIFSDFDNDGDSDLYVANDGQPNRLYINRGDGTFMEDSARMGVDDRGSGMGVSGGDYDGDGRQDLVVMNFDREYNALYRNKAGQNEGLEFDYATFRMGLQGFGQNQTAWGVSWLDLDLDGHLDLITAQGKVPITDLATDGEQLRIYHNRGDSTFRDTSRQMGAQQLGPLLARGLAAADYDNDGDMDVAIATIGGPLTLLQTYGASGNWLLVSLADPIPGSKLQATLPDGRVLVRELYAGSSYLASEDPRFHLGLGEAAVVEQLEIILPDGRRAQFEQVPANQILMVSMSEFLP